MKKNNWVYVTAWVVVFWLAIIVLAFIFWFFDYRKQQDINKTNLQNISQISNYLNIFYKDNYPYPAWDLVLLDKNLSQIHLEDKTLPLERVSNLYVIQWTTCWIESDSKEFNNSNFDVRFSTWENKKCFSYSVTKDKKYYQLWAVLDKWGTYVAYITWNINNSITKDYNSNNTVINWKSNYLPYLPSFNNKILLRIIKWAWKVNILEDPLPMQIKWKPLFSSVVSVSKAFEPFKDKYSQNIRDWWLLLPILDSSKDIELSFSGNKFAFELIYPNGNMQFITPNKNWEAKVQVKWFEYNWINSKISIFNLIWKIAYNLVKLSDDSNYSIYDDKWVTLTIRWTKFAMDIDESGTSTSLVEWKISIRNWLDNYIVDQSNSFIWFDSNKNYIDLFKVPEKLIWVSWLWVALDILLNKPNTFEVRNSNISLSWETFNYFLSNNKDIKLTSSNDIVWNGIDRYSLFTFDWYFDDNFAISLVQNRYKANDLFNDICKENWFNSSLDIWQAYKFLWINELSDENISFSINKDLTSVIKKWYILSLKSNFNINDAQSLFYYDWEDWQIKYKNVSSNNTSDKRNWLVFICTK